MKGSAILFDAITTKPGTGFPFDVWYLNHYLPAMSQAGSWLGVRRYGSPSLGTHLAVFEADTAPAKVTAVKAGHEAVTKVERYVARHIGEQIRLIDPPRLPTEPIGPTRLEFTLSGGGAGLATAVLFMLVAGAWRLLRDRRGALRPTEA